MILGLLFALGTWHLTRLMESRPIDGIKRDKDSDCKLYQSSALRPKVRKGVRGDY